jgi:hypothetical protein
MSGTAETNPVAGLDPVIHVFCSLAKCKTWMAGSNPAKGMYRTAGIA